MNRIKKVFEIFAALVVIGVIMIFMLASGTQAQWPFWGVNSPWFYSMPSFGSPFFPLDQIPSYFNNNNPFLAYNSFLNPALPLSSGSWDNNPEIYTNPYGQNWFDNSAYRSRSYTPGYSDFQPPPLGTPGYTNWLSYGYDVQLPLRYGSGPPIPISRPEREPIDFTSGITRWVQFP